MSLWQAASRTLNGWVSQYGILSGMKDIQTKRSFEISPYLVLRTDRFEKEAEDPFKYKGYDLDLSTEQFKVFFGKRFDLSNKP